MAIGPKQELNQSQNIHMTPQLQQAIKILQYSNLEIADLVEQEMMENPLLEMDEFYDEASSYDNPDDYDSFDHIDNGTLNTNDMALDADYSNEFDADNMGMDYALSMQGTASHTGSFDDSDYNDPYRNYTGDVTLRHHLEEQIVLDFAPKDRPLAIYLIDCLDASGWFKSDVANIAVLLNIDEAYIIHILERCQLLDPAGVFARNLGECLAIQLRDKGYYNKEMAIILDNLPLLAEGAFAKLCKLTKLPKDVFLQYVSYIRQCEPKPATRFTNDLNFNIDPDLFLTKNNKGKWQLEFNDQSLPKVTINQDIYKSAARYNNKENKKFMSDKLQAARWLLKSIEQRNITILKVATELVKKQQGFFDYGITHLKPLILRNIAEETGLHESTISRVTTNKYISSPRGVFELKYFFTSAIGSASGLSSISAEAVRHRIKKMLDTETVDNVLSDDAIVDKLVAEGIDIARRTVAKYRESMKIPSSVQRRRLMKKHL